MPKFQDLTGQKFNYLTVIKRIFKEKNKGTYWLCKCVCGNETIVAASKLKSGHTKSCGCKLKELCRNANIKHNMTKSREFVIWCGIKQRCFDKNSSHYNRYGGRGITVCPEWLNFENFYKDMGNIPKGYSIDRIDNNGNYEPNNCRIIPIGKQKRNTSKSLIITYNNDTDCLINLCEKYNKDYNLVYQRIHNGWEVKKAFECPKQIQRGKND